MKIFKNKVSFIIATKNRPDELARLLESFRAQSYHPDHIIIVDAGNRPVKDLITGFQDLNIRYEKSPVASAAKQRNIGLKILPAGVDLVGFLDDDIVLEPDALELMMEFWEGAGKETGGVAFNIVNIAERQFAWLKSWPLVEKLGLYSAAKGKVLPSGFHTMIGRVSSLVEAEWIPACAAVWRRDIFDEFKFDEWFTGYSYLEDLDFSYRVGKKYKILVLGRPKCYHYSSGQEREGRYLFGKKEILNRIYFVKKNQELSLFKCYLALWMRMLITLANLFSNSEKNCIQRILGNISGMILSMRKEIFVINRGMSLEE